MTLTKYPSLVKSPPREFLYTHSRLCIPVDQCPLNRGCSAILGEEGGVYVDCVEREEAGEEGGGDEVPERSCEEEVGRGRGGESWRWLFRNHVRMCIPSFRSLEDVPPSRGGLYLGARYYESRVFQRGFSGVLRPKASVETPGYKGIARTYVDVFEASSGARFGGSDDYYLLYQSCPRASLVHVYESARVE